jgi:tetratricopeptide (TPR) repeat protein
MSTVDDVLEAIPVDDVDAAGLQQAAALLEQALRTGPNDPNVAYLLGLCYKRLGRTADARTAFRKIASPDANVHLQMGLLSLAEKNASQARQEFERAWQADPTSYAAGYDLVWSNLLLGDIPMALELLPQILPLAPSPEERRFLEVLLALLESGRRPADGPPMPPPLPGVNGDAATPLAGLSADDEERILTILSSLGSFELVSTLLHKLAVARPFSAAVQSAYLEAVLVQARKLTERCQWTAAERLLAPFVLHTGEPIGPAQGCPIPVQAALLNLLGCCTCMTQDFDRAVQIFGYANRLTGNDPGLQQNLALAHELQNRLDLADTHWNRFLDLLDRRTVVPPGQPRYLEQLAFETLKRLSDRYSKLEKWPGALNYCQRAHRLRPQDFETMEQLFHLYSQLKRFDDARKLLKRMRDVRPNDPQLDLYELDLRESKSLEDLEHMLSDIRRILNKYPNDLRVEERAVSMVANIIPLMGRQCDQLTERLNSIADQVRRLPQYQINWQAVHDVMRDLFHEFQKLRRITNKCLTLVTNEEHRRIIRDLSEHIDRKIEQCQAMGA